MTIAVVMPVGPTTEEVTRAEGTIASIRAWEPQVRWIVLVDGNANHRSIEIPGVRVLPHPLRGRTADVSDRVAAATLAGFQWARGETDATLTMKIDTDALVIAPFADKLTAATGDSSIGLVGSYDQTCNGESRSFRHWRLPILRAARDRRVRAILRQARRNGYRLGEHALGCAIAVHRRALDRLVLDDPCMFVGSRLFDDPIFGLLIRQAGFRLAGDVEEGGTFALAWRGLPDTPERLLARGFSVIHTVKNDQRFTEQEIRAFFAARTPARGGP